MEPEKTLPYLALEIKTIIASYLEKADLKCLRSTSREWNASTTPFLFDKIYISPRDKDLQVFANITKDPHLAASIKQIIFDTTHVPELNHKGYFENLIGEIRTISRFLDTSIPFYDRSRRVSTLLTEAARWSSSRMNLFSEYKDEKPILDGFHHWKQLRAQECRNLSESFRGPFTSTLHAGLERLPRLDSIDIDDSIFDRDCDEVVSASRPGEHIQPYHTWNAVPTGSPLSRGYHPLHLRPRRTAGYEHSDRAEAYLDFVIKTFKPLKQQIKHFTCNSGLYSGLAASWFTMERDTNTIPQNMMMVLHRLETLDLQITPSERESRGPPAPRSLGFLPEFLEQLTGLKDLTLNLLAPLRLRQLRQSQPLVSDLDNCYAYSEIFPRLGVWPRLETFYVRGLAIDGIDLVVLVNFQMPRLKNLGMRRVDLSDGTWKGVVEFLRRTRGGNLFVHFFGLFRHENNNWWPCSPEMIHEERRVLQEHADFIMSGGRHPSLPAAHPDSFARGYIYDLFRGDFERVQDAHDRCRELVPKW